MNTTAKSTSKTKLLSQRKEYLEILVNLSDDLPWQHQWWSLMNPDYRDNEWMKTIYQNLVNRRISSMKMLKQRIGESPTGALVVRLNLIDTILCVAYHERKYSDLLKTQTEDVRKLRGMVDMIGSASELMPEMFEDPQIALTSAKMMEWTRDGEILKQYIADSYQQALQCCDRLLRQAFLAGTPSEVLEDYSMHVFHTERSKMVERAVELRKQSEIDNIRKSKIIDDLNRIFVKCDAEIFIKQEQYNQTREDLCRMLK